MSTEQTCSQYKKTYDEMGWEPRNEDIYVPKHEKRDQQWEEKWDVREGERERSRLDSSFNYFSVKF